MKTAITLGVAAALSMAVLATEAKAQGYFGSSSWFGRSNAYARNLSLMQSALARRNSTGYGTRTYGGGLGQVAREDRQRGYFRIPSRSRTTYGIGSTPYSSPWSGGYSPTLRTTPYQAPRSDRSYQAPVSDGRWRAPVSDGGWVSPRSGR